MRRKFSVWGVSALGVILLSVGGVFMLHGWELIQVERGYSQFIAGAAILAGGAVVLALGQVVARLDELVAARQPELSPQTPIEASEPPSAAEKAPPPVESVEIDRYQSGDVTYVMFSDGAVEVRKEVGAAQRFASLAELRAKIEQGM